MGSPTLVVLGASGDLAARLLFPALLSLEHRERLEDLRSSATPARSGRPSSSTRTCAPRSTEHGADVDEKYLDRFIERIEFHGGDISVESLRVAASACSTVPRSSTSRCRPACSPTRPRRSPRPASPTRPTGWRRLVIEKPFGTDLDVRARAQRAAAPYWREDQIFRIDHFLGKETVQNILVFRFANRFIEPVLRAAHVDEIQITVAETLGVEGRSRYYDGIGALRDMIQNHLIQMMTFATMEPPALWDAEMIRDHKVEVLEGGARASIPRPTRCAASTPPGSSRASRVIGVPRRARRRSRRRAPTRSRRVRLHLDTWRWEGVPVLLRSGKRLAAKAHEVAFRFREPPTRLFRHTPLEHAEPNWLVFRMSPTECTELVVRTKQPGLELEARESVLRAEYAERRRPRGVARTRAAARRARRRPHAVPALRRGRVVVAHRRPGPQGVEARARPRTTSPAATDPPASTASSAPATPGGRSRRGADRDRLLRGRLRFAVAAELLAHRGEHAVTELGRAL